MQFEKKETETKNRKVVHFDVRKKKEIVTEIEQGNLKIEEAIEKYSISFRRLEAWIDTYASVDNELNLRRSSVSNYQRRRAVHEVNNQTHTIKTAAKAYGVSPDTVRNWLSDERYSTNFPSKEAMPFDNNNRINKIEQNTVKALELKIAALEMMIDLAEETYEIDIRKKCGTKQQ